MRDWRWGVGCWERLRWKLEAVRCADQGLGTCLLARYAAAGQLCLPAYRDYMEWRMVYEWWRAGQQAGG